MKRHHTFRPTALDALEERLVLSALAAHHPGVVRAAANGGPGNQNPGGRPNQQDQQQQLNQLVTQVTAQINQAYASFVSDFNAAFKASNLTPDQFTTPTPPTIPTPTTPNAALTNLRSLTLQRVQILGQQVNNILRAAPGTSPALATLVNDQIAGLGQGSLLTTVNDALSETSISNPFGRSFTFDPQGAQSQVLRLAAGSQLGADSDVNVYAATIVQAQQLQQQQLSQRWHALHHRKGHAPRPPAPNPALPPAVRAQDINNQVNAAFSSYQSDISSAFNNILQTTPVFTPASSPTEPLPPPGLIDAFRSAVQLRTNILAQQLSATLGLLPGAETALVPSVNSLIIGPNPGSLASGVSSALAAIGATGTGGSGSMTSTTPSASDQLNAAQTRVSDLANLAQTSVIAATNVFAQGSPVPLGYFTTTNSGFFS